MKILIIYISWSSVFLFMLCHFKAVHDYIILHNIAIIISMLITFTIIYNKATRDVVIFS